MKKSYVMPKLTVIGINSDIMTASVEYAKNFGTDDVAEDIFKFE